MPLEGLQLGKYRVLRQLGGGGMGEVYLAEDTRINRQVAIKIVRSELAPYPDERAIQNAERLFQREMKAISRLDHPRILPLYDYGEENVNGSVLTYMVMPYRSEGSLADWLRTRGGARLNIEEIGHIVTQAADALQHAHDHQIVHQDVKPSNFLVHSVSTQPARPDIFLADFGIARSTANTSSVSQNVRGTPSYMAPEQWEGQASPSTDQYALAIMTYLLLTGTVPFQGGPGQVMRQHFTSQPLPPGKYNPAIPPALDAVILRALAKKPGERFSSVSEFARTFQQALQQSHKDLHATLTIGKEEAERGTIRNLTLPGPRQISVMIPAQTQHGQIIRMDGQGDANYPGGERSALLLTVNIAEDKAERPQTPASNYDPTATSGYIEYLRHQTPAPGTNYGENSQSSSPQYSYNPTPNPLPPLQSYSQQSSVNTPLVPSQAYQGVKLNESPKPRRGITPVIIVLLLLFILIGTGIITLAVYNNTTSTNNANATAEALNKTKTATAATAQVVQSTATASAAAAVTATAVARNTNPYLSDSGGKLLLDDPLSKPSTTWTEDGPDKDGGSCLFKDGAYHVGETKDGFFRFCSANSTYVSDFVLEVRLQILNGHCGGLTFREIKDGQYYLFRVCQDGNYGLSRYTDGTGKNAISLRYKNSPAIKTGTAQNVIAVAAKGTRIHLYINGSDIDDFDDTSYGRGGIGLIADYLDKPVEVAYTNLRLWNLVA